MQWNYIFNFYTGPQITYRLVANMHVARMHLATCEYSDVTNRTIRDDQHVTEMCHKTYRILNIASLLPFNSGVHNCYLDASDSYTSMNPCEICP